MFLGLLYYSCPPSIRAPPNLPPSQWPFYDSFPTFCFHSPTSTFLQPNKTTVALTEEQKKLQDGCIQRIRKIHLIVRNGNDKTKEREPNLDPEERIRQYDLTNKVAKAFLKEQDIYRCVDAKEEAVKHLVAGKGQFPPKEDELLLDKEVISLVTLLIQGAVYFIFNESPESDERKGHELLSRAGNWIKKKLNKGAFLIRDPGNRLRLKAEILKVEGTIYLKAGSRGTCLKFLKEAIVCMEKTKMYGASYAAPTISAYCMAAAVYSGLDRHGEAIKYLEKGRNVIRDWIQDNTEKKIYSYWQRVCAAHQLIQLPSGVYLNAADLRTYMDQLTEADMMRARVGLNRLTEAELQHFLEKVPEHKLVPESLKKKEDEAAVVLGALYFNWGVACEYFAQVADASKFYAKAYALCRRKLGPEHPVSVMIQQAENKVGSTIKPPEESILNLTSQTAVIAPTKAVPPVVVHNRSRRNSMVSLFPRRRSIDELLDPINLSTIRMEENPGSLGESLQISTNGSRRNSYIATDRRPSLTGMERRRSSTVSTSQESLLPVPGVDSMRSRRRSTVVAAGEFPYCPLVREAQSPVPASPSPR